MRLWLASSVLNGVFDQLEGIEPVNCAKQVDKATLGARVEDDSEKRTLLLVSTSCEIALPLNSGRSPVSAPLYDKSTLIDKTRQLRDRLRRRIITEVSCGVRSNALAANVPCKRLPPRFTVVSSDRL